MKITLNRLLIGALLTIGSIIMPYTKPNTVDSLEFYIGPISCLPKYFFCTKNIMPTNPSIDCFEWGQCEHLRVLESLVQSPYVQMILKDNTKLNKSLTKTLNQYGKGNLSALLENYSEKEIESLVKDLIKALQIDENVLSNAGLKPTPLNTDTSS